MTHVNDRYHVVCDCCSLVSTERTLLGALNRGEAHQHDDYTVEVYDTMAHRGAAQLWRWNPGIGPGGMWSVDQARNGGG